MPSHRAAVPTVPATDRYRSTTEPRIDLRSGEESFITDQPQGTRKQQTSIAPLLSVRNGAAAIAFYKIALGS